jgi:ParB/RepB/Spo0J family partition protein
MNHEIITYILLSLIDMLPQVRERINPESIVGLAMSMKEVGLQQAIRVRRLMDRFVVVDGHRRVLAALQLGLEKIAAIIEDDGLTDADIVQRQLIANIQREDFTNVERGRAFNQLMTLTGLAAAEVARKTGVSPATVSRDTAILTLPPEVLRRVESGEIKASTAYHIAITGNSEEQSKLAEATANGRLPRDRVVELTRRSRRASQRRRVSRPKRERFTVRLGPGRSLTVSGPNLTLTSLTEWLQALLKRIGTLEPQDMALADAAKALSADASCKGVVS